ncbi:hypothetical protein FRC02_008089, partial [Tulasnella sp. 418]
MESIEPGKGGDQSETKCNNLTITCPKESRNLDDSLHPSRGQNDSKAQVEASTTERDPLSQNAAYLLLFRKCMDMMNNMGFNRTSEESNIELILSNLREALFTCPLEDPIRSQILHGIARCLRFRFSQYRQMKDLEEAITVLRQSVRLNPFGQPSRAPAVGQLGEALLTMFHQFETRYHLRYLKEATDLYQEAAAHCPPDNPDQWIYLTGLGRCWSSWFDTVGGDQELDVAVKCHRLALDIQDPTHPARFALLETLASSLQRRFEQRGDLEDVNEAIRLCRDALAICPREHLIRHSLLSSTAASLLSRFQQQGEIRDLEEAIQLRREAVQLNPRGDPLRYQSLTNLAIALQSRFQRLGNLRDVNEAILLLQESLKSRSPEGPGRWLILTSLATSLRARFDHEGDLGDLTEAIRFNRESVILSPGGNPNRPISLANLANVLFIYSEHQGDAQYLEEAIDNYEEALSLYPSSHPNKPATLSSLAVCLENRFKEKGALSDLEIAIKYQRDAVALQPVGHENRSIALNSLANSLHDRYSHQGDIADLDEAIAAHREALALRPVGHPDRASTLSNLAVCLRLYYDELKNRPLLQEAVKLHREALLLRPWGNPARVSSLINLASVLTARYGLKKLLGDLNEAIDLLEEALRLQEKVNIRRAQVLTGIANALILRFEHDQDIQDYQRATQHYRDALAIVEPFGYPIMSAILSSFANAHITRSKFPDHGDVLNDAGILLKRAIDHPTAGVRTRFEISMLWAAISKGTSALSAYRTCLELASRYVLVRPTVTSRHKLLASMYQELASDIAAAAIEDGEIEAAIELLEQGRSVLWSQMGQYRTPLDDLRRVNPELATELEMLGQQLENVAVMSDSGDSRRTMEEEGIRYRQLSEAWDGIVGKIRQQEGFEAFLQTTSFAGLKRASANGPVIIVNSNQSRSDAIIIRIDGDPILVALSDVRAADIDRISEVFSIAILPTTGERDRKSKIFSVLRQLWELVVKPVIDELEKVGVAHGSRIWWSGISKLSSLPLHAAGPYQGTKPNLPDLYVSSYTSTLSSLIRSSRCTHAPDSSTADSLRPSPLLVVAQPK